MATQQELEHEAGTHARATTWSWDKWLSTIRKDPNYAYKNTNWYHAGLDLEQTKDVPPNPNPPAVGEPDDPLDQARCRIFLANDPLEALAAPNWMIPVCTADLGYRHYYSEDTISQLYEHFGTVEAWCDCRNPTAYHIAETMVAELDLDGPAWGQCETTSEFDHAYQNGARRMVGSIDANVLDESRLQLVKDAEVLISMELYCNRNPNLQPDWRNANNGIGGNCIGVYGSIEEGATHTPVQWYIDQGFYIAGRDSVYGVGLHPEDWKNLA